MAKKVSKKSSKKEVATNDEAQAMVDSGEATIPQEAIVEAPKAEKPSKAAKGSYVFLSSVKIDGRIYGKGELYEGKQVDALLEQGLVEVVK